MYRNGKRAVGKFRTFEGEGGIMVGLSEGDRGWRDARSDGRM